MFNDLERKKLEKLVVAKYPFLRRRDIDGTVDIESKFPLMSLEIPTGWRRLFFQMCDDIKPLLEKEGVLNDFYFLQVKEKYNELICYSNGVDSHDVEDIISKYQHLARYICTKCGKLAAYETYGYIASFCDDCWNDCVRHQKTESIEFQPYYNTTVFTYGERYDKTISFEDEWNRYVKEGSHEEF